MNVEFYIENCYKISELITKKYSTSFSLATSLLENEKRRAIYAIYGFVRLADEIVDSFYDYDRAFLLEKLNRDLDEALQKGISTNAILAAFSDTVHRYNIDRSHILSFMESMKYDLIRSEYTENEDLDRYIYGSANVVGLMCLKVFCNGDQALFDRLQHSAQKLGAAFQKVNFLRDLKADLQDLGRSYFPQLSGNHLDFQSKHTIEQSIENDFSDARTGIGQLPGRSRLAVALAYYYYYCLFFKIKRTPPARVISERIRISNFRKYLIIIKVVFMYKVKMI